VDDEQEVRARANKPIAMMATISFFIDSGQNEMVQQTLTVTKINLFTKSKHQVMKYIAFNH
jgi:hypothetical protein